MRSGVIVGADGIWPTPAQRPADLLSDTERRAMDLTAELAGALGEVVGHGPTRTADLGELIVHVHAIQQAVLSQAAARAYPDRYRLLGEVIDTEKG